MSSQNRKVGVQQLWQIGSQQKGVFIEEINARYNENKNESESSQYSSCKNYESAKSKW